MNTYDTEIQKRLSGSTWEGIRQKLLCVHRHLLGVDDSAALEPSTIYVKYKVTDQPLARTYAVLWLRSAKKVVLGLATPEKVRHHMVTDAPARMKYTGLTSYVTIPEDRELPCDLEMWVRSAFENIKKGA